MRRAALLLLLAVSPAAVPAQEPTKADLLRAVEKHLRAAADSAGPCVACLVVSRSDRYPRPPSDAPGALGDFDPRSVKDPALARQLDLSDPQAIPDHGFACGVVIDEKGFVLTPYHVIDGATKIYVHLPGRTGSYADVHAADARNDLAVLRLLRPPAGLKALKFGSVRLDGPRERVTVSPGKLAVLATYPPARAAPDRPSVALGCVTNVRPDPSTAGKGAEGPIRFNSYYYHGPLLEHDAKLGPAVSGAALLDLDGELIGLTTTAPTLGLGDRTPDYALPMDDKLRRVIDVLRRGEEVEYGYLGVSLVTENQPGFSRNVIRIYQVVPSGPTDQAGIRAGDVITHISGTRVYQYEELLTHISAGLAGSKVTLTVQRGLASFDTTVTLGKLRHGQPFIASVRPDPVFGLRVDHGSLLTQRPAGGKVDVQLEGNGVPPGVTVQELVPNSPAAAAFKKLGDNPQRWLITGVNGGAVGTPAAFYAACKDQASVKLTVIDTTEPKRNDRWPTREVTIP